jgi:hypothetical protein
MYPMPEDMVSLRLGEQLRERLARVIQAAQKEVPIRGRGLVGTSRSLVIRAALEIGLGQLEKDLGLPAPKAKPKK